MRLISILLILFITLYLSNCDKCDKSANKYCKPYQKCWSKPKPEFESMIASNITQYDELTESKLQFKCCPYLYGACCPENFDICCPKGYECTDNSQNCVKKSTKKSTEKESVKRSLEENIEEPEIMPAKRMVEASPFGPF